MKSIQWTCQQCGNHGRVVQIMIGRRVRCPACASFSPVRPRKPHLRLDHGDPTGPGKGGGLARPHSRPDTNTPKAEGQPSDGHSHSSVETGGPDR